MEPPSYEDVSRHPPLPPSTGGFNSSFQTGCTSLPPTPPPTYREAVSVYPDVFPVLTPLSEPAAVIPPSQNSRVTVHPLTQIGEPAATSSRRAQTVAVVSQPQPVPVTVTSLREAPALVQCPHCGHLVTTDVKYLPGFAAWCSCVMLALVGLICGFCLIPLTIRRLQDAHHSCPHCGKQLHVYQR